MMSGTALILCVMFAVITITADKQPLPDHFWDLVICLVLVGVSSDITGAIHKLRHEIKNGK